MRKAACACLTFLFASAPAFAERLPTTTTPSHYDLAFDVQLSRARFDGVEAIDIDNEAPTTRIVLHAAEITFHDVTIEAGGRTQKARVTLDAGSQTATLRVPRELPSGHAAIHIQFTGILNNELRGLYLSQANGRRYAVSQLESTDARRMFPSFDEPVYKATFSLTVTIDRGDNAISNGKVLSDTPGPGPARHTLKFATTPKMSSYLVALAVGDFECLAGAADNTPIRVCTIPDKQPLARFALEAARYVLHYYDTYYAIKYPFEKLDMVAVPDFAAGAMENTAAIFYRDTDLLVDTSTASIPALKNVATVVAHEMAHQWFGDLVTMKWWDDLWLNEGFATWMESRPVAAWHPEWHMEVDQALDTQRAIGLDSLKSTHAIRSKVETPAEIDESFDLIAYEKGAAVVRMIENYVGTETFQKGVNAYLAAHAYGNATSEDFASAIAAASGKPIDRIVPSFVGQPGVPLVSFSRECADGSAQFGEHQRRFALDSAGVASQQWVLPLCKKEPDGRNQCDELSVTDFYWLAPGQSCTGTSFLGNAGALGYYRSQYPADWLAALASQAEHSLSAPERVSLVGDSWALVNSGEENIRDFLTLASGFGDEPSPGVLGTLTTGLFFSGSYLTSDANRAAFQTFTRALFKPSFTRLGITSAAADDSDRRELRPAIISVLGDLGNDPDVVAASRRALDTALSGGTPLDPTAADAIITVAASHGDAALWDALSTASAHAHNPDEQYRYLFALGAFRDPALVKRGLENVLSPNVRSQNAGQYLERFLSNIFANQAAWTFFKEHFKDLQPKLSVAFSDVGVVQAMGSFCDASTRDDVKAFFSTHKLGNAARSVDQTIEKINNCISLKERQSPILDEWLRQR
jgi:aminopeptidase N